MSPAQNAPAVAIAMATHEPDPTLLAVQIDSIREQVGVDWICAISDDCSGEEAFAALREEVAGDPRFLLSRSPERLGFYRNFERALGLVPPGPELIALADQDDRWAPQKLERLTAALGSAALVHSDARIVDAAGKVISPSYWVGRRPNRGDLASLLVANTVTGAASLFRRELLERALPFPPLPGAPYHDHWLALVALASDEIAYLPEPLYDYVQHRGAVLGHVGGPVPRGDAAGTRGERWRRAYEEECLRVLGAAAELARRCEPLPDPARRRQLRRLRSAADSPSGLAWLAGRALRHSLGASETGGAERTLLAGLLWRRLRRPGR